MELQRESYSSRQSESSNFREILRKKDKEMNAVLDQIEVSVPYPSLCIHQVLGYNGFTYICNHTIMYMHWGNVVISHRR